MEGIKKGQNYSQIANDLGRSIQYIANIKKVLIERGLISQEEIDFIYNATSTVSSLKEPVLKRFKEGKTMQEMAVELNTSSSTISVVRNLLIEEGLITLDEINKANKKVSEREILKSKILEGFRAGKLSSEISSELRTAPSTISRIKKELIEEGMISEQEISDLQNKSLNGRKSTPPKNINHFQLSDQEKEIINLLLEGYPLHYISKTLNIDSFDLTNTIETLKSNKHITSSEISKARSNFKQNGEKSILTLLRRGYSQADILREHPYLNSGTLSRCISSLISSGKITKEQIEQYQYEAEQGEKKIMQFVLSKLQLGFTVKEIINADPNSFLTERRVINTTKKLISQGAISYNQIESAKAKRTAQKKKADYKDCDKKILTLFKNGSSYQEIADEIGFSPDFVYKRITILKQSGKLSDQKLEAAKKKRDSRKKSAKYSEDYKIILAMLKAGYTQQDIANELNKSSHFVHSRVKELKQSRKISDEELIKAAQDAKNIPPKQRNWHLFLEDESLSKEKTLINAHQSAKLLLQEKGIDEFTSNRFISNCKEMFKINILPHDDVPLLQKVIEYSFLTQSNLSFMIRVYVSLEQYTEAIRFLNRCIGSLTEDPNLVDLAQKTKSSIVYCQKQQRAVSMLKSGIPVEHVFRKVGLSEPEVMMLSKKYSNSDGEPKIRFDALELEVE